MTEASQTGGSLYAYKLPDIKRKRRIRSSSFGSERKEATTTTTTTTVSAADSNGNNDVSDDSTDNDLKKRSVSHDRTSSLSISSGEVLKNVLSSGPSDFRKVETQKKIDISEWQRSTLHKGFKVRGWGGIFSPGAPGFPYVFRIPGMSQVTYPTTSAC